MMINENKLLSAKFRATYSSILLAESLRVHYYGKSQTTVKVEDLKEWLFWRDFYPAFFSLRMILVTLRIKNICPKIQIIHSMLQSLLLLLAAWEAVNEAKGGKTVKGTLVK